jgi:hypothetical protein
MPILACVMTEMVWVNHEDDRSSNPGVYLRVPMQQSLAPRANVNSVTPKRKGWPT